MVEIVRRYEGWSGPTLDFPSDVAVPPGGSVELFAIADRPVRLLRLLVPNEVALARLVVDEVRVGMYLLLVSVEEWASVPVAAREADGILSPVSLLVLRDAAVFYDHRRWLEVNQPVEITIRSEETDRSIPLTRIRFAVEERP